METWLVLSHCSSHFFAAVRSWHTVCDLGSTDIIHRTSEWYVADLTITIFENVIDRLTFCPPHSPLDCTCLSVHLLPISPPSILFLCFLSSRCRWRVSTLYFRACKCIFLQTAAHTHTSPYTHTLLLFAVVWPICASPAEERAGVHLWQPSNSYTF